MHQVLHFLHYAVSFALVISIIVFIHEFGHFLVARLTGVKVEIFSIGFGHELFGITDGHGTRWKLAALPLGGYVKMFGDAGAVSSPDAALLATMTKQEKRVSFHHRPLWAKAAIVSAGPAFNFLLAVLVFTYFLFTVGIASTQPVIGGILPDTPAASSGLKVGDRILAVDGVKIHTFTDITERIATNIGTPVKLDVARGKRSFSLSLTPVALHRQGRIRQPRQHPLIGLKSEQMVYTKADLPQALAAAVGKTYDLCAASLTVMGQMVTGHRSLDELKGPLGIAKMSGQGDVAGAIRWAKRCAPSSGSSRWCR
ncbi:MAG: M50 family metallopeptidase [Alphaproteobacteria bacterium]